MDRFWMLTVLALRSMVSHRVKNTIVGGIMVVGTLLVVVGTSVLDSVKLSMQEGITASATGHVQVYSSDAKDDLAIFGQMGAAADIGELTDFPRIEKELRALPGVADVVPMALGNAVSFGKSELDRVLLDLRVLAVDRGADTRSQQQQIRQIAALMLQQNSNTMEISTDQKRLAEERAIISQVLSEGFWVGFSENPGPQLEYLDTRFAPLSTEGKLLYIRYLATDPSHFAQTFKRFQIVEGQAIPEGRRGVLLSKRFYERQVKSRLARELDAIMEEYEDGERIASNEVLKSRVGRARRMAASVLYQLDATEVVRLEDELKSVIPDVDGAIENRITAFLTLDDANLEERYAFFYRVIAPMIDVYDIAVGEEVVLQSYTQSGYARSATVKVWGTFNFKGLEGSDLAGVINVMDLATFQTLYGKMTLEQRHELDAIREQVGVEDIAADEAEDALFGAKSAAVESEAVGAESFQLEADVGTVQRQRKDTYDPKRLHEGVILNAAIILHDPSRVDDVIGQIERLNADKNLGIRAVGWEQASGLVGQFILVITLVLYTAIVTIFAVALVIINNSMVMATMERVPEIGTIRAIGGQRSTIVLLTLLETTALCFIAGTAGAFAGAGLVALLGNTGIPASNDVMVFLFGGPRLYPSFTAANLIWGFAIILVVSVLSTIYPAMVANRVQPAVAMRAKE